ncbi:hypothetical protein GCM10022225_69320 [Plantactinospora mayteni]|uniref:Uncharacterized protein n=1 Tax=Plantactinospora mayteni TaxID=566021 RepID=A0ABQ4EVW2_9ACTN|nr:hypothetical protein [Plantactinospora mayteni]GIG98791.1 hypothetical protein Pma05_53640 [Plantactinospora mayteni]
MVNRVKEFYTAIGRITLVPLLVRCGVFLCALLALLLAYPAGSSEPRLLGLLVVAALAPAIAPRRNWPTLVLLAAAGAWVVATGWYDQRVELWRLLALATFLYLTHTLAALAALLSYDAVVAPEVLARWVTRALGVALASAVLSVPLLAIDGQLGDRGSVVVLLGGLALAVCAAALLGWLFRRR